jgi:glycerol uptake facilitator protein
MNPFLGELNGVVANVVLTDTKGNNAGWIVITWGWAMAAFSGAHSNPAVSVGLAIAGKFVWAKVPAYIAAQFLGAFIGPITPIPKTTT